MECRDAQPNDWSRSLVALDPNSTIIVVIELSQSSWLVGGVVPGIERQPCKKLEPSPERLLAVLLTSNPDNAKLIATIASAVALYPEARIAVAPSAAPIGSDVSNLARQISNWRIPGKRMG